MRPHRPEPYRLEAGAGRVGFMVTLTLFCIFIYLGIKFVPIYVNAYIFEDTLREEARFAAVSRNLSEAQLVNRVVGKAVDLELPISKQNVKVHRTHGRIEIHATYMVPVETVFFTYNWDFSQEGSAPLVFGN
ncbi:MAG: hypothetical protein V3U86_03570 [Acidobacteriota bacterium]|nr:hypothetical protein [Acidobacteriota bacterium]